MARNGSKVPFFMGFSHQMDGVNSCLDGSGREYFVHTEILLALSSCLVCIMRIR